jgi:hypothetical protein
MKISVFSLLSLFAALVASTPVSNVHAGGVEATSGTAGIPSGGHSTYVTPYEDFHESCADAPSTQA